MTSKRRTIMNPEPEKLRECPFCGSECKLEEGGGHCDSPAWAWTISCKNWKCGIEKVTEHGDRRNEEGRSECKNYAISHWNTRSDGEQCFCKQSRDGDIAICNPCLEKEKIYAAEPRPAKAESGGVDLKALQDAGRFYQSVPQDILHDCLKALKPFERKGEPNTLVDMVQYVCAELAKLQSAQTATPSETEFNRRLAAAIITETKALREHCDALEQELNAVQAEGGRTREAIEKLKDHGFHERECFADSVKGMNTWIAVSELIELIAAGVRG